MSRLPNAIAFPLALALPVALPLVVAAHAHNYPTQP
jgi:hypothetical protein